MLLENIIIITIIGIAIWIVTRLITFFKISFLKTRSNSGDLNAKKELAEHYCTKYKFQETLPLINAYLLKFPNDEKAINILALSYVGISEYQKAKEILEKLLIEKPNDADNIHMLGYCFFKLGDENKANLLLAEAIQIDKKFEGEKYF